MATIAIPPEPNLGRMQRARTEKLQAEMSHWDIDAMVLLGNSHVAYATGARWPLTDPGRANVERPVAVVIAGEDRPHLFTPLPETVAIDVDLPEDHIHGPVYLEFDEGAEAFSRTLVELLPKQSRIAVDELPWSMRRALGSFGTETLLSADDVMGSAQLTKTPDELGFLRTALKITERAIAPVHAALRPGVRQTELTAWFLRAAFELGADANILDPIWQVMPSRIADGPWTTHGDIACPLLTTERELTVGDVLWVDTGISYCGFASDFGRTWVVGRDPTPREQDQFRAWREIVDAVLEVTRAGATGADMTSAALKVSNGRRPWMAHFYLGHGLGIESAEPPFIGTDLGDAYDERQVLSPGTVVVLEPLVWEEGASGYRAEEVVVVTDDGWISLTDYPYDPYGD